MSEPLTPSVIDKIVLLRISGMVHSDLVDTCRTKMNLSDDVMEQAIAEANLRISQAAAFSRQEQIGTALQRLNDLYSRAYRASDIKTCAMIQKELNKLYRLYETPVEAPTGDDSDDAENAETIAVIRSHLLPLELADVGVPIQEHARIAADIVRASRAKPGDN